MANIQAKKKNIKKIEKATIRNRAIKSSTRKAIKNAKEAILAHNKDAQKLVNHAFKQINTAVSKGVFHKNNGARKMARLDAFMKKHQ